MRPKKSGKSDYRTISLPNDLYEELFDYKKKHPDYVSVANFIRIAVREKMQNDLLSKPAYTLSNDEKNLQAIAFIRAEVKKQVAKQIKK